MNAQANNGTPRILSVGLQFSLPNTDEEGFYTEKHFLDYDVVILDPQGALKGQSHDYEPSLDEGFLRLQDGQGQRFQSKFLRCTRKLAKFIGSGGLAVVFLRQMPVLQFYNEYEEVELPLSELLPWHAQKIRREQGSNIEFSSKAPFNKFWQDTADYWSYVAVCENLPESMSLGNVKGHKDEVVAGVLKYQNGGVAVFAPLPSGKVARGTINEQSLRKRVFIQAISELHKALQVRLPTPKLPDWTTNFLLPGEQELKERISAINAEIDKLRQELKQHSNELDELCSHKVLFTGYDSVLENAIDRVLAELGFQVKPGPKGRVDRTATSGDHKFAVEVQGVKRGAKEDHARALTIWVQEIAVQDGGKEPKGLLVVNPYRDTPLDERRGKNFWPGDTIKICERQGHCAMTGWQLLGLYFDTINNETKREKLINKLSETKGLFKGYEDWSLYLTPVESKVEERG